MKMLVMLVLAVVAVYSQDKFKSVDKDGDGKISREELANDDIFDTIDTDGDGFISKEEASEYARTRGKTDAERDKARAKPEMQKKMDIAYGTARLQKLDVYSPKSGEKLPVMVFIHGGGWATGDKANKACGQMKADYFVSESYVYVSINYRLTPAVQHPEHVKDCAKALAWVHSNIEKYHGDPEKIFVMGHSAGAHLAALVSTDETRLKEEGKDLKIIKGTILLDGAGYDIPAHLKDTNAVMRKMYENAFTTDADKQKDASPISHIAKDKGIPPFCIIHVAERKDSKEMSHALADKLKEAGVEAEVHAAAGKTHGTLNYDIGQPEDEPTKDIMNFLQTKRR